MTTDRSAWPWREHWVDIAWGIFAVANLIAMTVIPDWETVPFHFIWVSLTLLYGFRVWRNGPTTLVLAVVIMATGGAIWSTIQRGYQPLDELTEVPLMAAMFVAMVWHARRRLHAMEESERVSMANLRLLESEHRFVQDASHELRTPITVALGHAELIQRRTQDDTTAEDAAIIADELLRLRRLADRLLVLAGSEDPGSWTAIDVELEEIVADAVRRWTATPRRWLVRSDGEAHVLADPERLAVALDALIENAVNHTREGDTIELGVRRHRDLRRALGPRLGDRDPRRGPRPDLRSVRPGRQRARTPDRRVRARVCRSSARSSRRTAGGSTCGARRARERRSRSSSRSPLVRRTPHRRPRA